MISNISFDPKELDENYSLRSNTAKFLYNDKNYMSFIEAFPAGAYFFSNALQIYGTSSKLECNDFDIVNAFIKKKYCFVELEVDFIGCDIFGVQFVMHDNGIFKFDLECAELSFLCNNFDDFFDLLQSDSEYMTGWSYKSWFEQQNGTLSLNQKIIPRKPFIIGGEFDIHNFRSYDLFDLIEYNSKIAIQIYNLPDGAVVEIVYEN